MSLGKAQGLQMVSMAETPSLILPISSGLLLLGNMLDHGERQLTDRNQWESCWVLRKTSLSQPSKIYVPLPTSQINSILFLPAGSLLPVLHDRNVTVS